MQAKSINDGIHLEKLTVNQLRLLCKKFNVPRFSKLAKPDLIFVLYKHLSSTHTLEKFAGAAASKVTYHFPTVIATTTLPTHKAQPATKKKSHKEPKILAQLAKTSPHVVLTETISGFVHTPTNLVFSFDERASTYYAVGQLTGEKCGELTKTTIDECKRLNFDYALPEMLTTSTKLTTTTAASEMTELDRMLAEILGTGDRMDGNSRTDTAYEDDDEDEPVNYISLLD